MKTKKITSLLFAGTIALSLTGCIEEYTPQNGAPSQEQVSNAPGAFTSLVSNLTGNLSGKRLYTTSRNQVWDYGYTSFFLTRDVEGQDIVATGSNPYATWYSDVSYLSSGYAVCQFPWTLYYGWINDCNKVIAAGGASNYTEPDEAHKHGVGIAYTMRAMFYLDLCRMYAQKPYSEDHNALTTIKADEIRTAEESRHQERMTWDEAFEFMLKDLDAAEKDLADYKRTDKYTPDKSVVYGLKARVYLEKQDWANAEKYAKLAQQGYSVMTESQFLDHSNGFNTPDNNSSWMFATQFKDTDPSILTNDGNDSWGSCMITENSLSDNVSGYATGFGAPQVIDKHLYSTIPNSDFRKKCWLPFSADTLASEKKTSELLSLLEPYSCHQDEAGAKLLYRLGQINKYGYGGLNVKFRPKNGILDEKYKVWEVSVPLMRVEEMKLIEIEAAGMQDLARGKQLLTEFAKTRDPQYVYGKHNEAYYNTKTSEFQNEVWWQRRIELWGEGFATFDIKRLNKGIIRSYAGTNHIEGARWNTNTIPNWMVWTFIDTESGSNGGMTLNPDPVQPSEDSPAFKW